MAIGRMPLFGAAVKYPLMACISRRVCRTLIYVDLCLGDERTDAQVWIISMGRRRKLISCLALCACGLAAQSRSIPPCAVPEPGKLVSFEVAAVDANGQPARDLRPGDFRVLDAGKAQQIVLLRPGDSDGIPPEPAGPHNYSNRSGTTVPHVTVVLFDTLNADIKINGPAWGQMVRALERFESDEYLYLYLLTEEGVLYPVHGLPKTGSEAADLNRRWVRETLPQFEAMGRNMYGLRPAHPSPGKAEATWYALTEIISLLSDIPGRKNILWIGNGAPFSVLMPIERTQADPQAQQLTQQMRRFVATLDEAQVAIYTVGGNGPAKPAISDEDQIVPLLPNLEQLEEFPALTGGRAWDDGDISRAMAQAIEDIRTAYRLGYYPPAQNWDGKYHKIRVTCMQPGIRVNAKKGYVADQLQDLAEDRESDTDRRLDAAAASAFEATGIGLRVSVAMGHNAAARMHLQIHVYVPDLLLLQQGARYCGEVAVEAVAYTDNGRKEMISAPADVAVSWSEQERDAAMKTGLRIDRTVELANDVKKIRLVVLDRRSLALGSVDIPVSETRNTPAQ